MYTPQRKQPNGEYTTWGKVVVHFTNPWKPTILPETEDRDLQTECKSTLSRFKRERKWRRPASLDLIACDEIDFLQSDVLTFRRAITKAHDSEAETFIRKYLTPIVKGEWINKGLHINAFGADCPWKSEIDASTITKADKLVIDYELALDTKELRVPIEQGMINENDIYGTIGEIVAGIKPGRESPLEFTIFKNTGMPIPYVTISTKVYEKAVEKGLRTEIDASFKSLIY